jgi:hypothetical protein
VSWAKFDDLYDDHRKIKRAWKRHPRAVGLHSMAVTYCARHETDGVVDPEWLEEKLPATKERNAVLAVLVDCGLFEPLQDDHYLVHDYLDFNESRADAEARRRRDSERKRGGAPKESNGNPNGIRTESNGIPKASRARPRGRVPDPTRPDLQIPLPPGGKRARDWERYRNDVVTFATSLGLNEPRDGEAVERAIREVGGRGHPVTREVLVAHLEQHYPNQAHRLEAA